MSDPTSDFDPRFDPRFQPGFDPDVHGEQPRGSRNPTAEARAHSDSRDEAPIVDAEELAHGGALDGEEQTVQDAAAAPPRSEVALLLRNPFLWVIVVLGVGLVAWGWSSYEAAVNVTANLFNGGFGDNEQTQAEYTSAQFALGLAPFAITVGALVLIGVCFFAAVTWRRSREARR